MRSKTSTWFETKVRYDKTMDDGREKKVTEVFVVDALSFTEAETKDNRGTIRIHKWRNIHQGDHTCAIFRGSFL